MSMPSCVTKNIMANKRTGIFSQTALFALLALILSITISPCTSVTAQEKKPEVKAATSLEEERLKILRADLQAQIEQLKKLKQELEVMQKGLEGKRQEQLTKVVKIYEAMAAEEAAKALEKLDDDTAIQILSSLKARSAGKIMGQLDPDRAAALSKKVLVRSKGL
jgi:flagellar motility protein MotE (MotC chaperone)